MIFTGIDPVVIRSEKPVSVNEWTSISFGRRHGEGFLRINEEQQVVGKSAGATHSMYLKTNLFVGGYDKRLLLNKGVGVNRGFDGCVSGVSCRALEMHFCYLFLLILLFFPLKCIFSS